MARSCGLGAERWLRVLAIGVAMALPAEALAQPEPQPRPTATLSVGLVSGLRSRTFADLPDPADPPSPDGSAPDQSSSGGLTLSAFVDYRVHAVVGIRARAGLSSTDHELSNCDGCGTTRLELFEAQLELLLTVSPVGRRLRVNPVLYAGTSLSRFWMTRSTDGSRQVNVPGLTLGACVEVNAWHGRALVDLAYTVAAGSWFIEERGVTTRTALIGYALDL